MKKVVSKVRCKKCGKEADSSPRTWFGKNITAKIVKFVTNFTYTWRGYQCYSCNGRKFSTFVKLTKQKDNSFDVVN